MKTIVRRLSGFPTVVVLVLALALGTNTSATADPTRYTAVMNGASVEPPNPSTGTGDAVVIIDPVAHTMYVFVNFALMGITLQAHIHAPTTVPLTGVAAPATGTPTLPDFPFALSFDDYEKTLDMTQESSYSPEFL
ncbi:MAG TPA: CHRD domain-containing protein, partial [Candidatus Krumholzibacteria bacterium]|nr:CHRD domain-containing protein [Candidatus Krumholzibacteria bacterium]